MAGFFGLFDYSKAGPGVNKGKTNKKLEYIKLHKDCYLAIKCNLMIAKMQYIG